MSGVWNVFADSPRLTIDDGCFRSVHILFILKHSKRKTPQEVSTKGFPLAKTKQHIPKASNYLCFLEVLMYLKAFQTPLLECLGTKIQF